ncbi:MAG: PHP-associated domain-containing protein [Nanoarchaeota archaeon]
MLNTQAQLKTELHIHTNLDPKDTSIRYTNKQIIDEMYKRGYHVIGITCHDKNFDDNNAIKYAKTKGITLIEGIEKTINKQHVLIYNAPKEEVEKIKSLNQLQTLKNNNPQMLIIAPHPYFIHSSCLKDNIKKYKTLFDAYEISFFYLKNFNLNKKTIKMAQKYNKPLVGNCDVHNLNFQGNVYTLINSSNNKKDIINAIKQNKTIVIKHPLTKTKFFKILLNAIFNILNPLKKTKFN